MECVRLARINTGSCAMPLPLCDQPETGNREVVIERERKLCLFHMCQFIH